MAELPTYTYDLFISYADEDEDWVEGFLIPALGLSDERILTREKFRVGADKVVEFEGAVTKSRYILLIVSPAFIADVWVGFGELIASYSRVVNQRDRLLPLILQSCDLPLRIESLISFNFTNETDWGKEIARLRKLLEQPEPTLKPIPCPYPGMKPFRPEDARFFYGREQEIENLLRRLRKQNYFFVIGPSGSGKSSFVFAGLVAELAKRQPGQWLIKSLRPGENPMQELAKILGVSSIGNSANFEQYAEWVESALLQAQGAGRILLIIDQFEELFSQAQKQDQTDFIGAIKCLRRVEQCTLILTMRADFYPDLMNSALWPVNEFERVEIVPLRGESLRKALVSPAEKCGVYIEAKLQERLIDDAADEPGVLPLIQETMVLLWEKMQWRLLTLSAYEKLGETASKVHLSGLSVAIATHADAIFGQLNQSQQAIARRIFLRLVQFGEGRADTRRQQLEGELQSANDDRSLFEQTLEHLVCNRLLTRSGEEGTEQRKVDIAHEALIESWPSFQNWLKEWRKAEQARRRLEAKVEDWERLERRGGLLDIFELKEAEEWLSSDDAKELGYDKALSEMVVASRRAIEEAEREEEERQQRELELIRESLEQEKKALKAATTRNRILFISSILLVGLTTIAGHQTLQANFNNLGDLSTSAESLFALNRQLDALAKSIEAGELLQKISFFAGEANKIRILTNLNQLIYGFRERNSFKGHSREVSSVNFSPNGQMIASASSDTTIKIWNSDGQLIQNITGLKDTVYDAIFNNKGNLLVSVSKDNTIKIWEMNNGCFLLKKSIPISDKDAVFNIALSPDNQIIASDTGSGKIQLWDLNGEFITYVDKHQDRINNLSFSPDGQTLASAGSDNFINLWSLKNHTLNLVGTLPEAKDTQVFAVKFIDNKTVVSSDSKGKITVWDLNTKKKRALGNHNHSVNSLTISKDRKIIASASYDGTVKIWDIKNFELLQTLRGHVKPVMNVSFSDNSKVLASSGEDGTVKIWEEISPIIIDGRTFSFSPDSQLIVTGDEDGNVKLWSKDGNFKNSLYNHEKAVFKVGFSPDGKTIVSTSEDRTVKIWEIENGKLHKTLIMEHPIKSISFGPDSKSLATASADEKAVKIWNLENGEPLQTFTTDAPVTSISFNPDGKTIAVGTHNKINIWSLEGRKIIQDFTKDDPVSSISFSPDGKTIAVAGQHSKVDVWYLDGTRNQPQQFNRLTDKESVLDIAFSPHGQAVALAYQNQTVILWNLADLKNSDYLVLEQPKESILLHKNNSEDTSLTVNQNERNHTVFSENYQEYNQLIQQIGFSPDGKVLASANSKNIVLWNFDLDSLLKIATSSYGSYSKNNSKNDEPLGMCK